jgi:hypothetical protein
MQRQLKQILCEACEALARTDYVAPAWFRCGYCTGERWRAKGNLAQAVKAEQIERVCVTPEEIQYASSARGWATEIQREAIHAATHAA